MDRLNFSADELLTTTRAVRKRLDLGRAVSMAVIEECLEIALQAPTASNAQNWHFVIVTDAEKKAKIGDYYRDSFKSYLKQKATEAKGTESGAESRATVLRLVSSAQYLADNLEKVPVLLIPCVEGRIDQMTGEHAVATVATTLGSIVPATWSFMLAARERGLGTCWTTLHLAYEKETAAMLGIPFDRVTQVAMIPVAYTVGTTFKAAARKPLEKVLHLDRW